MEGFNLTITYKNTCTNDCIFKWDAAIRLISENVNSPGRPSCGRLQIFIEPSSGAVLEGAEECRYTTLNHDEKYKWTDAVHVSNKDDYFIHEIKFAEIKESKTHRIKCRKGNGTFKDGNFLLYLVKKRKHTS